MELRVIAIVLLVSIASIGNSKTLTDGTCYNVGGIVNTKNVTSNIQLGTINLQLSNEKNPKDIVFSKIGFLSGNIVGTEGFVINLSHTARFSNGNGFVTDGDKAKIISVRNTENEIACSYYVIEKINNIARGTRFFRNVTSVDITADGYVSNCPEENENFFDLSGKLCLE